MAPPPRIMGDGRKAKNPKQTFARLLGYLLQYKVTIFMVLLCILAAALVQSRSSVMLGTLVDEYILPMVANGSTDFQPILRFLMGMVVIFLIGLLANFLQNFLMVRVTQGIQKKIRDDMFCKMQTLPLRYFDSNTAGNIMSRYTGDIDTLRQMISQAIPQTISAAVTLVVLFVTVVIESWILTLVSLITISGVFFTTKFLAGKAGKFFMGQQKSLGAVNGYIEEMITGQKVVKVFNHEEVCKQEFDKLNEELCSNAFSAGKFSNMMGPINNNLGYVQYAILAIIGGILCVVSTEQMPLLSLGSLMAFMVLSRNFNMPISQVSQQFNAIIIRADGSNPGSGRRLCPPGQCPCGRRRHRHRNPRAYRPLGLEALP